MKSLSTWAAKCQSKFVDNHALVTHHGVRAVRVRGPDVSLHEQ